MAFAIGAALLLSAEAAELLDRLGPYYFED